LRHFIKVKVEQTNNEAIETKQVKGKRMESEWIALPIDYLLKAIVTTDQKSKDKSNETNRIERNASEDFKW
jgi:hypothetical protein